MKTASQCSISDQYLTKDADTPYETMIQFVVYRNEPLDTAQVPISNYEIDVIELPLSITANCGSEPTYTNSL